jgi:outer membrane immunogenic protein
MRTITRLSVVMLAIGVSGVPAMADEWDGFYAGIEALYGQGHLHDADDNPDVFYNLAPTGVAGGAHFGYRFQNGAFVVGAVADADLGNITQKKAPDYPLIDGVSTTVHELASGRLLAGYTLPRTLIYATGGVGWGRFEDANYNNGDQFGPSLWQDRTGWVAGVGVEREVTQNLSLGIEYLHYDFGSWVYSSPSSLFWGIGDDHFTSKLDTLRFALNYRFGGPRNER